MATFRDNLDRLHERVERALERGGRSGGRVDIVAVTKNIDVSRIEEAVEAGHRLFGENRVQEAMGKIPRLEGRGITWHMIGHLQRNKVKAALPLFSLVHSLDSTRLASELSKRAGAAGRIADLLVQVNTSGQASKFGVDPGELERFLEFTSGLPSLRVKGLMTIGPFTDEESRVRQSFRTLRNLFESARGIRADNMDMCHLSMGMTADFEMAVEEGSNMIRVGTALFGPREQGGGRNENHTA